MLVSLRHSTRYLYDRPVTLGPHEIRLKPVPGCRTPVSSYTLAVRPDRHTLHSHYDAAGNPVARVLFQDRITRLEVDVALTADLAPFNPFDFLVEPGAASYPLAYPGAARAELAPYLCADESGGRMRRWLQDFRSSDNPDGRDTVDLLVRINERIRRDIGYVTRMEQGVQSCEQTLELRSGSCRDSGWLLVQVLRHFGFAARFVSGYLIQLSGSAADAPRTDGADLHAWAEAYLPGAGWIGFDPTSGMLAAEGHIPLARAATPALAAPVTGSVEPCNSQMQSSMSVQRT
ncbi:MAG TPA: transglutaminase family protein [Burkholderiales bacterium]|nr:transglutaminase family protein [Burkholderiales bacterium]